MTTIPAWSHSAVTQHHNCPWNYHELKVSKNTIEEKGESQSWGLDVHKQFEWALTRPGFELREDLKVHQHMIDRLTAEGEAEGCFLVSEQKVALSNKPFSVCEYFDKVKPVWWRGVIDAQAVNRAVGRARIVDFKTGRKKEDWAQLAENAVWMFTNYPWLNLINAQFYWTSDQTYSKRVWGRSEMDTLVGMFAPKVSAFAQSYKTDIWPKKQSGLCKGHCPTTACMFWEPKKNKF